MKKYKPRTIQEFGCDYCNKRLQSEKRMGEHEKKCYYNESRICPNCHDPMTGENTRRHEEEHDDYYGGCTIVEVECQPCKNAENAKRLRAEFIKNTKFQI